jgi:hypothetical protein
MSCQTFDATSPRWIYGELKILIFQLVLCLSDLPSTLILKIGTLILQTSQSALHPSHRLVDFPQRFNISAGSTHVRVRLEVDFLEPILFTSRQTIEPKAKVFWNLKKSFLMHHFQNRKLHPICLIYIICVIFGGWAKCWVQINKTMFGCWAKYKVPNFM